MRGQELKEIKKTDKPIKIVNSNYKYLYIFAVISFILSIYLISFSFYNLPSADDFIYGAKYSLSPFILAINDYFYGSSGRVFSNTIYYFFAGISNNNLIIYQILPFFTFVFFAFVSYLLLSVILKFSNKLITLSFTSIFIFIWLLSIDSMNDTILWYGGIFNYLLPMTLMLLSIYLVLKSYFIDNKASVLILVLFSSIILFISSFSNEALFLVFFLIYMLIFIYNIYYKNYKLTYRLVLNIIVLLTVFLLILFAPGSANRAGDGNTNLFFGIYRGLMTSLERGFSYYFATAIIPCSLFLYLIFKDIKPKIIFYNLSYKTHGLIFILSGIIVSWTAHFVVSYGLGAFGLPPRAKVIPQTASIIAFISGNIYLLHSFNFYKKFSNHKIKYVVFIAVYMSFAVFNSDDFIGSMISLGEHKSYYEQSIHRLEYLENADKNSKEIVLKKIDIAPYPIAPIDARMISSDCNYYVNTQLSYYYNYKGCIRLESGIDGENSLSKQYFRLKEYIIKDGIRIWFYSLFK